MRNKSVILILFFYFIANSCSILKKESIFPQKTQNFSIVVFGEADFIKEGINFSKKNLEKHGIYINDDFYLDWNGGKFVIDDSSYDEFVASAKGFNGIKVFIVSSLESEKGDAYSGFAMRRGYPDYCNPIILISKKHFKTTTLLHEIGHILGLKHHKEKHNVMYRKSSKNKASLTPNQIMIMKTKLAKFKKVCGEFF